MALSKSTITGRGALPTDENLQFAELTFALSGLDTEGASVLPGGISKRVVLIDSDIPAGFDLWQNTAGLRGTHYRVLARCARTHGKASSSGTVGSRGALSAWLATMASRCARSFARLGAARRAG